MIINEEVFKNLLENIQNRGAIDIKIVSDSMNPILSVGEIYTCERKLEIKKFDIIVFYRNNIMVAHFISNINTINEISYTTRSLRNWKVDELPVPQTQVLGVLKIKLPWYYRLRHEYLG